jgi:molybdopterin synthase catalytic subunit
MLPLLHLTTDPLDPAALAGAAAAAADRATGALGRAGAVASFVGVVRGEHAGRRVVRLEYEAYEPLAIRVFVRIAGEAAERWPDVSLGLHHRLGRVDLGEASVAIAAASPHRAEAFAACRFAIERVKQIAPIWKHEFFEGGDVWIEGATADPDDERAREEAVRRSCV